jgi:hypothetical protein
LEKELREPESAVSGPLRAVLSSLGERHFRALARGGGRRERGSACG